MNINHHNHNYDGGTPDLPIAAGDRYYSQDLGRDFWFLSSLPPYVIKNMYKTFPILLKDSYIVKGTAWTDLNIPAAAGFVEYSVKVPDDFSSLPPTVKTVTSIQFVESPALTNFSISGTATLDGVTTNYVKLAYNETNGSTRNRKKKAGSYAYERVAAYTITVSAAAPTNSQVVLAEVIGDGATFLTINRKTRTPLLNDSYDYIVRSQTDLNQIITRVSANRYKIIDSVTSVKFINLAGGYNGTGFLTGGDTWGYIETNLCTVIYFEPGTYILDVNTPFYMKFTTDYGKYENIWIKGSGGATSAIVYSFYHTAKYCQYVGCKTSGRKTSVTSYGFYGDTGDLEKLRSTTFQNCIVSGNDSTGGLAQAGFSQCYNLFGCYVSGLTDSGGTTALAGFGSCINLVNCYVYNLNSGGATCSGFSLSNQLSSCVADLLTNSSNVQNCCGFAACERLNACNAKNISTTGNALAIGFSTSYGVVSCYAQDITASVGTGSAYGFSGCDAVSGCRAKDITGITLGYGFDSCDYISSCYATDIAGATNEGFHACTYGAALYTNEAANSGNDWIDTVDANITNKVSTPSNWT